MEDNLDEQSVYHFLKSPIQFETVLPTAADQQSLLELDYCQKQNYAIKLKKKYSFYTVFNGLLMLECRPVSLNLPLYQQPH